LDWPATQVKYVFDISLGKMLQPTPRNSEDVETPYLKSINVQWNGINTEDLSTMWANATEIKGLELKIGDLLVCEGGEVGRASILREEPPCNCIYQNALHRVRSKKSDVRYLKYCLKQASEAGWFDVLCNRATIAHFTVEKFRELRIHFPSSKAQRLIADYLDRETARIDSLMAEKEKMLSLMEEKRFVLISQAVTRGLNPDVPLKSSGLDWLGYIPAHWETKKLKYVASLKSGETITADSISDAGNYPVYGGNGLRGFASAYTHVGDFVLIGRQGALCGNINYASDQFWASEHAIVVSIKGSTNVFWLGELLRFMNLNQYSQSAAQPGISVEIVENLKVPIPSIQEQNQIAAYMKRESDYISIIGKEITKTIALLKERRASLITAAVTGQIPLKEMSV
jgi:type I restriction enzyme S subunit